MNLGNPERFHRSMAEFAYQSGLGLAHGFNLRGPINVPTVLETFLGIFPEPSLGGTALVLSGILTVTSSRFLAQVKQVELPDRIRALPFQDDPVLRPLSEQLQALRGMPTIMYARGRARDAAEEVALLYCVLGMSAATALRELKERITRYQEKQN